MRLHGNGRACDITVSSSLLQKACSSYVKFKEFEEDKKRKALEEKRQIEIAKQKNAAEKEAEDAAARKREQNAKDRKALELQEIELQTSEKEQHNLLKSGGLLLHEAESKLHEAIKTGDMDRISIAHGLLEVARKRMESATNKLCGVASKRKTAADKLKRICSGTVSSHPAKKSKGVETVVSSVSSKMNKRIETVVSSESSKKDKRIENVVTSMSSKMDKRIETVVSSESSKKDM